MQTLESSPKIDPGAFPLPLIVPSSQGHTPADDPRWRLAQRIAASSSLGRSRLLSDFLLYVVDRHIRNRGDEITEQQIGVLVFRRPEGYDSNEDNIVRSYARNLRKRLEEYFATEGVGETLLLEIPRGGYAPIFSSRTAHKQLAVDEPSYATPTPMAALIADQNHTVSDPSEETQQETSLGSIAKEKLKKESVLSSHRYIVALALVAGIALGACGAFLLPMKIFKRTVIAPAEAESDRLWRQIFSPDRDTVVVPSDDGLVIMQNLTPRPVPLNSYVTGSYRAEAKVDGIPGAAEILKLGARRYTSVVDLDFVARVAQLDEVVPGRMMVRYARDLRMDDLRTQNAILIGSIEANPWIELFQPQLNFRYSIHPGTDKASGIVNMHPRPGEGAIYGTPGPDHTYGLIAYVPNLDGTGHVLIVGGLNTAGTQAATRFLLTPSLMKPTLERARTKQGFQPFELLIGAGNIAANAATPQMILERIGSD
jgi:hypothetical protein